MDSDVTFTSEGNEVTLRKDQIAKVIIPPLDPSPCAKPWGHVIEIGGYCNVVTRNDAIYIRGQVMEAVK